MTSITAADLKLGGRLVAAADAMAAGKLRTAAGIFLEIGNDLNLEAENVDGLLSDEPEQKGVGFLAPEQPPEPQVKGAPTDLQSCSRGAHSFGPTDRISGWRTCQLCGQVNVAPPENNGPIDLGARQ